MSDRRAASTTRRGTRHSLRRPSGVTRFSAHECYASGSATERPTPPANAAPPWMTSPMTGGPRSSPPICSTCFTALVLSWNSNRTSTTPRPDHPRLTHQPAGAGELESAAALKSLHPQAADRLGDLSGRRLTYAATCVRALVTADTAKQPGSACSAHRSSLLGKR